LRPGLNVQFCQFFDNNIHLMKLKTK
jgi:hypothetical protein